MRIERSIIIEICIYRNGQPVSDDDRGIFVLMASP